MEVGDLHKVWEIRALKRKPDEPSARALLDRIAKQVQPIMRRRKWRVKVLSEFSPKNPRLLGLNVNGGVEVKLRLRRAGRDYDFIPYEEVLDTMLHELAHIARGPHDAQFYKLWDELRKECEELVSKGITGPGQGFDGTGRRLGGFSIHPPPPSLRQATLTAAQKRARNGALLPSGPRKLGGNNDIMSALSPIQAAAMAAERRMQDDLWCGSHDQSGIDDSEDVVILEKPPNWPTRDRKDTEDGKNAKGVSSSGSGESSTSSGFQVGAQGDSSSCRTTDASMSSLWECSSCTLLNQPLAPICEVCGTAKLKLAKAKYTTWSCKFCTLENNTKLEKCSACDQWRYSYGPPVATYGSSYD
ncbi:DNA-dependent metalloprotease WSS1 [Brachypodium distachyon]|uniref:WLM domain-containing protein n=1 Tax=Brachypodium distachyon TaxID=15368 RepID=I1H065_BRADI|nr:DNA-dependent metalloprotease WSS1 [Brachypodium distachyon]KQK19194.1 hypothetical protein BRADI_1g46900v3 [Brachypodium distachyon]KQK19195.1 hypothetical protein BRADI_1g46900v3 [Brachypodium distachyon]KQK19196.1 hypothetical protein BRADI_1g46900v3 [Brachypodium distachyon]PNT76307.1 hypothetical protein BRADI_1g46900v3 [Brachypodium distachyon]|eukprot:XP_003564173.1 DNA-dependent metalloprotease WSS1 [Brachypodium distachyon]